MVYETFKDVRLVGFPLSIGKHGGDTDNWMWPRHTGDFAHFVYIQHLMEPGRIFGRKHTMKPKHHFPVSLDGVEEGDYAMIMGFPGSTDRYLTSYGVQQALDQKNPTIVKIRDKKLAIMREHMNAKEKVRIQYASKYASTSNYWKYFIGQSKGLKRMKVYEKKKDIEDRFVAWVNGKNDKRNMEKYFL